MIVHIINDEEQTNYSGEFIKVRKFFVKMQIK